MAGPFEAEAPNRLTIAVDDLGSGLWSGRVKQELEGCTPLRNVLFSPSPSRPPVSVEELPVRYVDARSPQLAQLRRYAASPAAWFRAPFVLAVLVSCPDHEEYKRDLRLRLKAMADTEAVARGEPELLFVYVRPAAAEQAAKGPARVFDAMRRDLNRPRRERCVRLDPLTVPATQPTAPAMAGLDDFRRAARDALRAAFDARAAAYHEEVRRLLATRLDPAWSFATLFLVKDALGALLEGAGLAEDALREYAELEAAYLELLRAGQQPRPPWGGPPAGEDEAAALWSGWAATRAAASASDAPPEFFMRQALFAAQARLLLKLHRHAEVAERGLRFARGFGAHLAAQQRSGSAPPLMREAWSFAACVSLAEATSRLQAARAEEKRRSDHAGRAGGRRGRASETVPGTPRGAGGTPRTPSAWEWDSASQRPVPSPGGASPLAAGHARLQVRTAPGGSQGPASDGDGSAASPPWQRGSADAPRVDWHLGALPLGGAAASATGDGGPAAARGGAGGGAAGLYCLLAKLYCAARTELLRLGAAAGLEVPDCAASARLAAEPPHQPAAPPPGSSDVETPPASARADAPTPTADADATAPEPANGLDGAAGLSHVDLDSSSSAGAEGGRAARSRPPCESAAAQLGSGSSPVTLLSAPDLQLEPGGDAEATGQGADAAPGLAVPRPTGGDVESTSSSPRSTATHQSSLTPTRGEAVRTAAPAAVPVPATGPPSAPSSAPTSAREGANDMRATERQVLMAISDRSSRGAAAHMVAPKAPAPASPASAGAASLPPWLVHWRLRAALASQPLFAELFVELSEAAAACYARCGHVRSAALLRCDVADALVRQGSLQRAAALYEAQCRAFLGEGWHALAARTLPKLAACQVAVGSPGLAHTAAALLSLPPPHRGSEQERRAACQLLLQAAQGAEGLAGCRPLLPASPLAPGAPPEPATVALTAAIFAAPPRAAVSRFFGRTDAGGAALLAPPPGGDAGGALCGAVGDALAVQLEVDSGLSVALPLRDVALTLAVLQEIKVIHSPKAAPSPVLVLGSAGARPARSGGSAVPATPLGDSLPGLGPDQPPGESFSPRERYESRWQQVEELYCPLVAVTVAGGGEAAAAAGAAAAAQQQAAGAAARLQPLRGEVLLPPGRCLLTFLAAPVKRGLYRALHLRARLHQLPLVVAVQAPPPPWQQRTGDGGGALARSASGGEPAPRGGSPLAPDPAQAAQAATAIVLLAKAAAPRVQLSLLAAGGSLVAGQEQWLCLAVAPERDALHAAQLELTWPLGPPGSGGLALSPLSRKATALAPHHRVVHSHGGDMRLGGASGAAALQAALAPPPFLRPEHAAAALLPAGAGGGGAEVVPAEGPAGPSAAWLMADGLQQHVALPLVQRDQPAHLWWRVLAGEVAAPPEPVHIAPPAPRAPPRQLDMRRLGLPADPPPLPACVLDVAASLEYASGCQRSHSRVLGAPLRQPFGVACAARELPGGRVALQCVLTSAMAAPARLSRVALEPQPGFALACSPLGALGALPAELAPRASLAATFLLAPEAAAGAGDFAPLPAKLQPSQLVVEYSVDSRQQCGLPAAPLGNGGPAAPDAGAAAAVLCTPPAAVLEQLAAAGRQRAGSPLGSPTRCATAAAAAAEEDEADGGGRQRCCFRHLLALELPASDDDSGGAPVYVRQLGPFVATVGRPTTLCWRLERGGAADQQHAVQRIGFEVAAESDHWRPLGRRFGGVTLAGHDGAVATVEATWVPLAAGTLPVPSLRLQDVNAQEVFEVGLSLSGTNAITVVEARRPTG